MDFVNHSYSCKDLYFYVYNNMHGGVSKYYKDLSSFKLVVRFMPVIFIQAR
ncbi:hypothetical protein BSPLISOX_745 [uncultured Gammaproteobacteria bacterium]|nr:hypothetical protein [uncultured Gammaproteobacteria bacterium]VVH65108.1 hypothetical protein BSPLISOX_1596 [uncultured Gammaproteobacteria bacterium]VVH67271.1 hypothetical protein BSPLISOX_745 [uncultured Gammaproteobacteria bacterium]